MHDPSAGQSGRIRESREIWLDRLGARVAVITDGWYRLAQVNWDPDRLHRLHRRIKDLAIDSGRFGLARLSDALSALDICLTPHLSSDLRPSPQQLDELFQGMRNLKSAAEQTVRLQATASAPEGPSDTSGRIDEAHSDLIAQNRFLQRREFLDCLDDLVLSDPLRFGAALVVELDGLEQIRRQRGGDASEALLKEATTLLVAQMGPRDVAARVGEGTWAMLARRSDREAFAALAERLRHSVETHLFLSRSERITTTACVGLCEFHGDPGEGGRLLAHASRACARAQATGGNRIEFHAQTEQQPASHEEPDEILKLLQDALEQDGFRILLQPRINLRTRLPALYELAPLLPRVQGNDLARSAFVEKARDENLLVQIDHWIMEQALKLMERNRLEGVTVDLAVKQGAEALRDPARLEWLREQLRTRHLVGTGLQLEFSLPELAADLNATEAFAMALNPMGIGLSLAGFNGEAAALEFLKRLPLEYVELDEHMTAAALENPYPIVDRIHRLGIEVVAAADGLTASRVSDIVFPDPHQGKL